MNEVKENLPDSEIIVRVIEGDINAFETLIERHKNYVFGILLNHVPCEAIEEISQVIFIDAYKCLAACRTRDKFKYWLKSIAVRKCYDYWRREYKYRNIAVPSLTDSQKKGIEQAIITRSMDEYMGDESQKQLTEILLLVMNRLSAKERMVIKLIYIEGLSVKEASQLLGWSGVNTRVQAFRAKRKLRRLLSDSLNAGEK